MGFLKKLLGSGASSQGSDLYAFNVRCDRCGESIEGRVNLANDLSVDYDAGDNYFVRKVIMGNGPCFQQIEVALKFNAARQLLNKQVSGGTFIDKTVA